MRRVVAESAHHVEALLELRPAREAVFPRDDELRIGKRERIIEHSFQRLACKLRVVPEDAPGSGGLARALRLQQLFRLQLQLGEVGTRRQLTGGHNTLLS